MRSVEHLARIRPAVGQQSSMTAWAERTCFELFTVRSPRRRAAEKGSRVLTGAHGGLSATTAGKGGT